MTAAEVVASRLSFSGWASASPDEIEMDRYWRDLELELRETDRWGHRWYATLDAGAPKFKTLTQCLAWMDRHSAADVTRTEIEDSSIVSPELSSCPVTVSATAPVVLIALAS